MAKLTLEQAEEWIRKAQNKANQLGVKVSVYVVDQSTGAFVNQFAISTALNVGTFVDITSSTVSFTPTHGHTYSFTVTTSLGNSVIYNAKAA